MKTVMRACLVAAAALSMSCAMTQKKMDQGQPMEVSDKAPAGEGTVKAVKGDGGNTALTVKVKHLAPASRLVDDASVYVVWVEPPNAPPQNVGVLSVNADKEGVLNTLTPHRRFKVMITPEASAQAQEPSNDEVFTSTVDRGD